MDDRVCQASTKQTRHMYCRLECEECSPMGRFGVMVVGKQYVQCYIGMMAWWEQGFIEGFIALASHNIHVEPPHIKKEDMKIKMVIQPYPKEEVEPKWVLSCDDATHFVTPAFSSGHFAILLYNLQEFTVTVFDGLYMDIKQWEHHIIHTLKCYGIKPLDVKCKTTLTKTSYNQTRTNDWKTWENATVDGDVFHVRATSPPRVARLDGY